MTKTKLQESARKFDLKFLLTGAPGSGKTHLCGTYTGGPTHFYMLDPGGEKTLWKLLPDRPESAPITLDRFSIRNDRYAEFWKKLQQDEREGFFNDMAEQNGLVVLPDSLTAANEMALAEVARKNQRTLTDSSKPMRIQDWGILAAWIKELVSVINDLPCAVATIAHLQEQYNEDGAVIKRLPQITGKFANVIGNKFDEVYLLETFGSKYKIHFKEKGGFEAKSRWITTNSVADTTMNKIAEAYMKGQTL